MACDTCARFQLLLKWFGENEFLPADSHWMRIVEKYFCDRDRVEEEVCSNALFAIAGYDSKQLNLVSGVAWPVSMRHRCVDASQADGRQAHVIRRHQRPHFTLWDSVDAKGAVDADLNCACNHGMDKTEISMRE